MARQHNTIPIVCLQCNTVFFCWPYKAKSAKFCSNTCSGAYKSTQALNRFWSNVVKSEGCWNWIGGKDKDGYGKLQLYGASLRAHRFAYKLYKGHIDDTLMVLHTCDNPSCVREDHLYQGTNEDNVQDRIIRQRQQSQWGEANPAAKLSTEIVLEVRRLWASGVRQVDIGKLFDIDPKYISSIVNNKCWTHLN